MNENRVGGLREREYQLAIRKRDEACRKFDINCQTAKYFERESRLAQHFSSWSYKGSSDGQKNDKNAKAEKLRRRQFALRNMLREENMQYNDEIERRRAERKERRNEAVTVEELRRKLANKRAELANKRVENDLYYPRNNYRCYRSRDGAGDSTVFPYAHYTTDRHIDAYRNSKLNMAESHRRHYASEPQSHPDDSENRRHADISHVSKQTMYGTNLGNTSEVNDKHVQFHGERRHYETDVDSVEEGSHNKREGHASSDAFSFTLEHGDGIEQVHGKKAAGESTSEHRIVSERRHFGKGTMESGRSLENTNMREFVDKPIPQEDQSYEPDQSHQDDQSHQHVQSHQYEQAHQHDIPNQCTDEERSGDEPTGFHKYHGESRRETRGDGKVETDLTDNVTYPWKCNDEDKPPVSFLTHDELKHQIRDLAHRETQACKKQNWTEALRLRDMRNVVEAQRESQIFNNMNLSMNDEVRMSGLDIVAKKLERIRQRQSVASQPIYSEEAKILWENRVREDETILNKDAREQIETLLEELEIEWSSLVAEDRKETAEHSLRQHRSELQDELELTTEALEKVLQIPPASNESSKESFARNKKKCTCSMIFG